MNTIFTDTIQQLPTIATENLIMECEKVLGILGFDPLVNLSTEDRMNLATKFEYTRGFLTLKALVPIYATKKDSLLFKQRENPFVNKAQCQQAQKFYDKISYMENSFPYGRVTSYDFEQWDKEHLRLYIIVEYDNFEALER